MSISITGVDELVKRFGIIASIRKLEPPMHRSVLRLEAYMKHYPPAPPRSRYIRGVGYPNRRTSEKLGSRWTSKIDKEPNGLKGRVGNNASYGPWVQSSRFQTRFHARTGWRTDEQAVRDNQAAIVNDFQRTIERAIQE